MEEESFYLFFHNKDIKDLLIEEISMKYPQLKLSFSNKEFVSMKGHSDIFSELRKNPVLFAKRQALFLEKIDQVPDGDFVVVGKQYWSYQIIPGYCDTLGIEEEELSQEIPARAYLKMQQAHHVFNLDIKANDSIIEIGSAPGGISYYLLNLGVHLLSIDPAVMSSILTEKFDSHFTHLKKSIFDVKRNFLPKNCEWVVSDLNLPGDLNVQQVSRIIEYYPNIKGAFLTIKTPNKDELKKIEKWMKVFKKFQVIPVHLPSHRREMGLILKSFKDKL